MMDWLKDLKPLVDLGVTALIVVGMFRLVRTPPAWVRTAVDSHHQLAEGVRTLSDAVSGMPKREEIQELLIGQESLRRESADAREELRQTRRELGELRRDLLDGRS